MHLYCEESGISICVGTFTELIEFQDADLGCPPPHGLIHRHLLPQALVMLSR